MVYFFSHIILGLYIPKDPAWNRSFFKSWLLGQKKVSFFILLLFFIFHLQVIKLEQAAECDLKRLKNDPALNKKSLIEVINATPELKDYFPDEKYLKKTKRASMLKVQNKKILLKTILDHSCY